MKQNIYQHNLRLNLHRQDDLELHRALMNFDSNKYKSKNDFLKIKALESIRADDNEKKKGIGSELYPEYVTDKALEQRLEKVVADVLKELSVWLIKTLASGRYAPIENGKNVGKTQDKFIDRYRKNDEDYK